MNSIWPYLAIQNLLFFLFFQPRLLVTRRTRYLVLALGILISVFMYSVLAMDPFAWLLWAVSILLAYRTANKALRWVFSNREMVLREASKLAVEEEGVREKTIRKESEVRALEEEIRHVSQIYESVKEMSGTLEVLDLFVDLAQALIKNFSLSNIRMLVLKSTPEGQRAIEKVYQVDPTRTEFEAFGRTVMSKDLMFQGQAFPFDLHVAEILGRNTKPIYIEKGEAAGAYPELERSVTDTMAILPVEGSQGLEAVLMIEGTRRADSARVAILTDRFGSEFKRIKLYEDVQRLATTDWLTGLYVRRYFFKRLDEELNRCKRFNLKFSFLMIDIDDFKGYNDRYGHLVGDALLKRTAAIIKQNVREVDLVARYGGEEFAAILLDTDAEGAMFVGQRIRKGIEKEQFKVYDEEITLTVSIGLATTSPKITEASEIVEWADSALYQAKRQGKNRVCAFVP